MGGSPRVPTFVARRPDIIQAAYSSVGGIVVVSCSQAIPAHVGDPSKWVVRLGGAPRTVTNAQSFGDPIVLTVPSGLTIQAGDYVQYLGHRDFWGSQLPWLEAQPPITPIPA